MHPVAVRNNGQYQVFVVCQKLIGPVPFERRLVFLSHIVVQVLPTAMPTGADGVRPAPSWKSLRLIQSCGGLNRAMPALCVTDPGQRD